MRIPAFIAAAMLVACGGGVDVTQNKPGDKKIQVKPESVVLAPNESQAFSVTPAATAVVWSVQETGGGTITQAGLYTAPAAWGVFHVLATASPTVSASATVTVTSPVEITAPSPQSADACQPKQLVATVTGSPDTSVTWGGVDAGCGTVTAAGVFTSVRGVGWCNATAQANADPTKLVTIRVDFTERVLGVSLDPPSATVPPFGTQQFQANVTTTCGTFPAGG